VVGLFIAGLIGVMLVLYAVDRILKVRAQARRLRRMTDRLAAATARAEEQDRPRAHRAARPRAHRAAGSWIRPCGPAALTHREAARRAMTRGRA
jgi:hypothetical protein